MAPGQPLLAESDKNLVMHVEVTILGGHVLMGTDAPESVGFSLTQGNNVTINLEPDTRALTDKLVKALSVNGKVEMHLQEMFWGDYFGGLTDQFGIRWMFNPPVDRTCLWDTAYVESQAKLVEFLLTVLGVGTKVYS